MAKIGAVNSVNFGASLRKVKLAPPCVAQSAGITKMLNNRLDSAPERKAISRIARDVFSMRRALDTCDLCLVAHDELLSGKLTATRRSTASQCFLAPARFSFCFRCPLGHLLSVHPAA